MKVINKIFLRSFLLQALWNFENMQGIGFLFSIIPKLKELYKGEKLKDSMMKYMGFFNTHPYMALFVLGYCARREEEKNISVRRKEEEIKEFKLRMGGPLAALGDKIFWSTFRPFVGLVAVIGAFLHLRPIWLIPAGFLVIYNVPVLYFKYRSLVSSYSGHSSIALNLKKISSSRIFALLPLLGLLSVAVCLAAFFVVWGSKRGAVLLVFTAVIAALRLRCRISSTTLVYAIAALAVGYNLVF